MGKYIAECLENIGSEECGSAHEVPGDYSVGNIVAFKCARCITLEGRTVSRMKITRTA